MRTWGSNKGSCSIKDDSRHRIRRSRNDLCGCNHEALSRVHLCCCESRDNNTGGHIRPKKEATRFFPLLLLKPSLKSGQDEKGKKEGIKALFRWYPSKRLYCQGISGTASPS